MYLRKYRDTYKFKVRDIKCFLKGWAQSSGTSSRCLLCSRLSVGAKLSPVGSPAALVMCERPPPSPLSRPRPPVTVCSHTALGCLEAPARLCFFGPLDALAARPAWNSSATWTPARASAALQAWLVKPSVSHGTWL